MLNINMLAMHAMRLCIWGPVFWIGMTDMISGNWVTQWNTTCTAGCYSHDCIANNMNNPAIQNHTNMPFCEYHGEDDFCALSQYYTTVCWYRDGLPPLAIDGCANKYHTICPMLSVANGTVIATKIVKTTCGRKPIVGSTVMLQCDCGFAPAEPVVSECQTNNEWTESVSCTAVYCQPLILTNGWIQYSPSSSLLLSCNLTATVGCDLGYLMLGTTSLACFNVNGNWTGPTPQCLAPCLPLLEHFSRVVNYSTSGINSVYMHGTTANGTCQSSYSFQQNSSLSIVVCNNGSWNGPVPPCLLSCGEIPTWSYLPNITFTYGKLNNLYPDGTVATFACEEYFQLIGNTSATCVDGKWVGLNKQWCKVLAESKFSLWWWPWIAGFGGTILSTLVCSCLWNWWIGQKKTANKDQNT